MKWKRTLDDTWEAREVGRRWTIHRSEQRFALRVEGGFVEGGFATVETAKKRARELAQADDVEAALAQCRARAAEADTRRWVEAAKKAFGPRT